MYPDILLNFMSTIKWCCSLS